jgi:hypothetical protein
MNIHFNEEMSGTYRGLAEGFPGGLLRFQVEVDCVGVTDPRVIEGRITGTVDVLGVVMGAPLTGTIEISPAWKRTIAYAFTFPVNGKTYRLAGHKTVNPLRILYSMTTLPCAIYDDTGRQVAEGTTVFNWKRDMLSFLLSYRLARTAAA